MIKSELYYISIRACHNLLMTEDFYKMLVKKNNESDALLHNII